MPTFCVGTTEATPDFFWTLPYGEAQIADVMVVRTISIVSKDFQDISTIFRDVQADDKHIVRNIRPD